MSEPTALAAGLNHAKKRRISPEASADGSHVVLNSTVLGLNERKLFTALGFALDPVAWPAREHGKFQTPSRSVVAKKNAHRARIFLSIILTSAWLASCCGRLHATSRAVVARANHFSLNKFDPIRWLNECSSLQSYADLAFNAFAHTTLSSSTS